MQLSLTLVSLALAAFVHAGETAVEDKDVPVELSKTVDNKVEFCQNYLGWVKKEYTTVTDYYTKTKTDYKWDVVKKTYTISEGTKTITKDPITIWKTDYKRPHPTITTKTYTDTKWKVDTKWVTKTVTVKGGKHHKRGEEFDFKRGPDVHKWQRYQVSKACSKILKHVDPKTRTYTITKTVKEPKWVKTTITKTKTIPVKTVVPKYTDYYTPVVKKTTTKWLPRVTITKKAYTKVYKTVTKTKTKTVTVTKKKNDHHGHDDHHGGH